MQRLKAITVAFLFLFSLFFVVFNVSQVRAVGSTYYVATTGSDTVGDGSIGNPYKTLQKAINVSSNSDTIIMRGGNYPCKGNIIINRSGTTALPYTIRNYTGETPILNGAGGTLTFYQGILNIGSGNYVTSTCFNNITIYGLRIENASSGGWSAFQAFGNSTIGCSNIKIQHCTFYNCTNQAVLFYTRYSNVGKWLKHIEISNCTFTKIQTSASTGECLGISSAYDFLITHNTINNNRKIGIIVSNDSRYGNVSYNIVNITTDQPNINGIYLAAGEKAAPIYSQLSHVNVFNNYIWGAPASGCGIAITPGERTGGSLDNVTVYNNIINLTGQCNGIAFAKAITGTPRFANITDVTVKYNTIVITGGSNWGSCILTSTKSGIYRNFTRLNISSNILFSRNVGANYYEVTFLYWASTNKNVTFTNNLYNRTGDGATVTRWSDGSKFEATAVKAGPQLKDIAHGDFHLNATSPAISAGSTTYTVSTDYTYDARPQGAGYDIGAYEYPGPINVSILSDSSFTVGNGIRYGSGTSTNPYVLCNYTIYDATISGTTKNLTIKNCTILHHAVISGLSSSSNLLFDTVTMDGAGKASGFCYIYLTHTQTTFTNSKFYNLSYSYMKNG